jgi:hypothetical protein
VGLSGPNDRLEPIQHILKVPVGLPKLNPAVFRFAYCLFALLTIRLAVVDCHLHRMSTSRTAFSQISSFFQFQFTGKQRHRRLLLEMLQRSPKASSPRSSSRRRSSARRHSTARPTARRTRDSTRTYRSSRDYRSSQKEEEEKGILQEYACGNDGGFRHSRY